MDRSVLPGFAFVLCVLSPSSATLASNHQGHHHGQNPRPFRKRCQQDRLAGGVVERPASVAKELLENSLDAGATRIRIQVEAGGKKLIQITDNGCGMVRDDAMLAFERHATSKIKDAEDLLSVATLGFLRGFGSRSPSVSRLRLGKPARPTRSRARSLKSMAARSSKWKKQGLPPGTSIVVHDLFF